MRENRVEWIAGRWVVIARMGCPSCPSHFEVCLDIPESFVAGLMEEEERRQRKIEEVTPPKT